MACIGVTTRGVRASYVDARTFDSQRRAESESGPATRREPWRCRMESAPDAIVYDPELFRREILSRLRSVPLGEIMATTGCSKASPSDYRRGKRTSHVSTGMALARLVDVSS
jgi:hypothetical protein